ncbi:hypothetical protein NPIL_422511 [Nephila pilipes]|uniref:Uncharacterized protein n=1 Tax=Nephila pilipes TaxID=299642 RepID=A0A8X6Q820_NEPPI|nr:hypothetical protein NPIL_422511 [Nephila pilipes]
MVLVSVRRTSSVYLDGDWMIFVNMEDGFYQGTLSLQKPFPLHLSYVFYNWTRKVFSSRGNELVLRLKIIANTVNVRKYVSIHADIYHSSHRKFFNFSLGLGLEFLKDVSPSIEASFIPSKSDRTTGLKMARKRHS